MKLIVDTNKIVACLLKDGKVRRLLFLPFLDLYTVKYAFEEIEVHKNRFLGKVSRLAFDLILSKAKLRIKFIELSAEDDEYIQMAKKIASEFDIDDFPFIALALKLNVPIWTNDKKLIVHGLKSGIYLAMDTQAVEKLIQGKSLEEVKQELIKKYPSEST